MTALIKHALCLVFAVAGASASIAADPYPTKPIRIIVNSGAGAQLDGNARAIAQKMSENLGQPVVVENNAGGGGILGIRQVKGAPADGYTLLAHSGTLTVSLALRNDPRYELKDFSPIGAISVVPLIMVGSVSLPDKTLAELVARAKANPGNLPYASGGPASPTYLAAAQFLRQSGLNMLHVPYRGTSGALPDVLAGRVYFVFDGPPTAVPLVREGRLRAYGITSPKRNAAFPDIPTIAEQGFPDYSFLGYFGLVAPAGTPGQVVQRVAQALRLAVDSTELRERFRSEGSEPLPLSPEEFAEFLRQDAQRLIKLVADVGIPKE
jgi:tripartite-type tricarboxylate transporter receptor subunit TctC